ncbi:MAG: EAL domain-containing protein, partial [Selenomonadaceae bacterium]|nr:EAL domain-containing protein [Selenomonadaceae bacterium]
MGSKKNFRGDAVSSDIAGKDVLSFQGLLALVDSLNMEQENMEDVYRDLMECLIPVARELHLAKSMMSYEIPANVFVPEKVLREVLLDPSVECAPKEAAITVQYDLVLSSSGSVTMWPVKGHIWTEEEEHSIRALSKFIFLVMCTSAMTKYFKEMPYADVMTGLLNGEGMRRFLRHLHQCGQLKGYSIVYIDLKNFKYMTHKVGAERADVLLKKYSRVLHDFLLQELIEKTAGLARLGVDHFMAVLPAERMEEFLEFARAIVLPLLHGKKRVPVPMPARFMVYTVSEGDTDKSVLNHVVLAYCRSRNSGKELSVFTRESLVQMMEGQNLSIGFQKAMQDEEIRPFYQPKVDLKRNCLCGAEALVRWVRDGKTLSPGLFLPALEMGGNMHELDMFILRCACRDIRRWIDEGLEPVSVSVNLCRDDLLSPTLVQEILETLEEYRIKGKYIELELTESSSYEDIDLLNRFIESMHRHGLRVAMDDFGTGYSSLNFLKQVDFDVVKLDKSFVDGIGRSGKDDVMIRSMTKM